MQGKHPNCRRNNRSYALLNASAAFFVRGQSLFQVPLGRFAGEIQFVFGAAEQTLDIGAVRPNHQQRKDDGINDLRNVPLHRKGLIRPKATSDTIEKIETT